jgi:hypothetical protein
MFVAAKNEVTKAIKIAKNTSIQSSITSATQSQKSLFRCVDEHFGKCKKTSLPSNIPETEIPDAFCKFFVDKVQCIQRSFENCNHDATDIWSDATLPSGQHLNSFKPATEDEVHELIIASKPKSCSLDIVPTFLIKEYVGELLSTITSIINCSLSSASIQTTLKTAIVTPILKNG